MKTWLLLTTVLFALFLTGTAQAQVPNLISYQGRVVVGTANFNGSGQFKFALVNTNGSVTYWSNDGTSTAGSQPTNAVTLTVTQGLYSLQLGDTTLANMTTLPYVVFANSDVRLRIWFNDGTDGFQQLTPDQRIAAVGYAMVAAGVPNGAITSAQIANGAVGSAQLSSNLTIPGTLGTTNLALPATTSASSGVVTLNNQPFLQAYGRTNVFIGGAGNFVTIGSANIGTGTGALAFNTIGMNNLAYGDFALYQNQIGSYNIAIGTDAMENENGSYNTAVGDHALSSPALNTNGLYNVAYGAQALQNLFIGTNNIAIGYQAGLAITTGNNNVYIANPGASESNAIRIGKPGVQTNAYIAGIYGTTLPAAISNVAPVYVNSSGQLGTVTSSTFGYVPTGGILIYPTTNAPSGYLPCNGASESPSQYPALFSVIGNSYGGSVTNFFLPTLTNNVPTGIYIIKY